MRALAALLLSLAAPFVLAAQAPLGSLLYANPAGRGIRLWVVDGGVAGSMTIRKEEGTEDRLRRLVLALAGPERFEASTLQVLIDQVPPAWTVDTRSGGTLLRVGEVTYWRYLPGQVLPVRFIFDRETWALQSAALPGRRFPGRP